jgi:DNA-binding transcriptional LysR family regulator
VNLASLDLNLFLVFEALMNERNVTCAGRAVGLSQPAMSNALARLRRIFNDQLFIRTSGGMLPTSSAQSLFTAIGPALKEMRAALETPPPVFNPASSSHTFHILANDYAEALLITPLVRRLGQQIGNVSLRLYRTQSLFQPPPASALSDTYDFALGFYPEPIALESSLRSVQLWEDRNIVLVRRAHPRIRSRLSVRRYADARHVAVFYKTEGPGLIDTLLAQQGLIRHQALLVPHFSSVPHLVASSDMIATFPERFSRLFRHLKLRHLPVPIAMPPFRLTMVWHERRENDPAHRWLRDRIKHLRH